MEETNKKAWLKLLPEEVNFNEAKRLIIEEFYKRAEGNISRTAKLLGIARITVRLNLAKKNKGEVSE